MTNIGKRCVLLGTAAMLSAPRLARAQQPVQIGATVPITGPFAPSGIQYYNSLRMAQDDIAAAGGTPIRIVFEDTQGSNTTAVNAYVRLVRQLNPPFIFLSSLSTQNLATEPEVTRARIPCMYAGGAVAVQERRNPWMFRIRPADNLGAAAISYAVTDVLKRTRPGILYTQDDYGTGVANGVEALLTQAGVNTVAKEAFSPRDNDFSAQLLSLRNRGADVILAFTYNRDGALILRQRRSLSIDLPVISGSAMVAPSTLDLVEPADLAGLHSVADAVLGEAVSPQSASFVRRYTDRWGFGPDPFGAAYYDGALIVAQAIREVGPDAQRIRDYLGQLGGFQGVTRTYRADEHNNLAHNVTLVAFQPGTKQFRAVASFPPA
jgi:branched-chain amino acid transport system substrate-binding protein